MFPITLDYIQSVYIDKNTGNHVTVSPTLEKDIIKNANDVLKLAFRGVPILFTDIKKIYAELSEKLLQAEVIKNKPLSIKDRIAAASIEADRRSSDRQPPLKPKDIEK